MAVSPDRKATTTKVGKEISKAIIKNAKANGLLPHEILLKAARGESFMVKTLVIVRHKSGPNKGEEKERRWLEQEYYPTFNEQIECAKAAAPYYAPRLASSEVKAAGEAGDALAAIMKEMSSKLPN